ncbi:MAG: hypothetical protein ACE5JR_06205 [Gemmatimonadota bacterium]
MAASSKSSQVSVRIDEEMANWIDRHLPQNGSRAEFVRDLLERQMRRERQERLREMFDRAAAELNREDLEEREDLLSSFADRD